MSDKPYRPELDERVRLRESEDAWIVLRRPVTGGYVVGPADGGSMRRIVASTDIEPWQTHAPDDAPPFSREEIEAALGGPPRVPPPWVMQVIDDLVAEWRAAWERQPAMLRGIELAANLASRLAARWVLAADPDLLAELLGEEDEDPRPLAIGTLAGVVLPVALQQVQPQT
jgi:hypothetical protein